jgi:tetratricopeptide (TPR) repeat protein
VLEPENAFSKHQQLGRHYLSSGLPDRAAEQFRAALALEPNDTDARICLIHCLVRLGHLKEARYEVGIVLHDEPGNAEAHYIASYTTHNWKEALTFIDAALSLSPANAGYHRHRGYILTRLSRYQEAINSIRSALELEPNSANTHRQMADTILDEAEHKGFDGHVSGLNRDRCEEVAFHVARARLKSSELDYEASLQGWQDSLRLDPTQKYAQDELRVAQMRAQKARLQERCWRVLYRWMPWPLRLPLTWCVMVAALWKGIFGGPSAGSILDEPLLLIGISLFAAFQTELLLRDWLQFVPDHYLGKTLRPLKKPPLR